MQEIRVKDEIIARKIAADDWKPGLSFFSKDEELIQVGSWVYDEGKALMRHIHNEASRQVPRTQEVLYVRKGSLEATIYDMQEHEVARLEVKAGEVLILLNCGHGYRILENDTQVLEIKNGPYLGADADRRRF